MGCTSGSIVEQRKVVPLPTSIVNAYIDRYPAIFINKIKQKFEGIADKKYKQLSQQNFRKIFPNYSLQIILLNYLFIYFSDRRQINVTFRQFMLKYAILTKCQFALLAKILFQIYKQNQLAPTISNSQVIIFLQHNKKLINNQKQPNYQIQYSVAQFTQLLNQVKFNQDLFLKNLKIVTQDDIPFQTINKQLMDMDFNDLVIGQQYYLLSASWFSKWSFFYQDANTSAKQIRSSKILNQKSVMKRKRKSVVGSSNRLINQSNIRNSDLGNTLLQPPNSINFQDIEGEFQGQLKPNLNISKHIKIISQKLWKLLCKLFPPDAQFKRKAISYESLQFYPKTVFFLKANEKGCIIEDSQKCLQLSHNFTIKQLFIQNKYNDTYGIFIKNCYQKNWRQILKQNILSQISMQSRFFICIATNKQKFIQKQERKQITLQNITVGDKVFTHFAFYKSYSQAIIIKLINKDKVLVHFKGHSYRYQKQVQRNQLSIVQSQILNHSHKKQESSLKGIINIGNTCFINSIVQSLVATPVFDHFLLNSVFIKKNQPLGHGLSQLIKYLLKDEKPSVIHDFKKTIDEQMPLFSGYNQHDAQQFLNMMLDRMSEQIKQKPTIIDYLFSGKSKSKLKCLQCKQIKFIQQKMYSLSLPIPQSQYNNFSLIIVPTTSSSMKKIIFRLHKSAKVTDYIKVFQQRINGSKNNYIFCQSSFNSLRRIKTQLISSAYNQKKIVDIGILPNIPLYAFQKLQAKVIQQINKSRSSKYQEEYFDFLPGQQTFWTTCKTLSVKNEKNNDKICLQIINQDNQIQLIWLNKQAFKTQHKKLGSVIQQNTFKKIILRRYNSIIKRLQLFGIQLLLAVPKWASYEQIMILVQKYIKNLKQKHAKRSNHEQEGDYVIRLIEPSKNKCIFCLKQIKIYNITQKDISVCCDSFDKNVPLAWAMKGKSYCIFIDWIDMSKCNSMFCSYIQIDSTSKKIEQQQLNQSLILQDCVKMHFQQQKVQMQCDKCHHKFQLLQPGIEQLPNIFIIHLKQFRFTPQGHLVKLDLRLKWQQYLESSYFGVPSSKLYQLYAIVRHSGTSDSGHYTSMVKRKHPFQNKKVWVIFDDDQAQICKLQQNHIQDPYLLFYKKVEMPTSSLIMYSQI